MKSFTVLISVLVLLAGAMFSVANGARTHQISYGDTLWDLAIRYYDNPFLWVEIFDANPNIEGVEYLYPGDYLIIPDILDYAVNYDAYFGGIYTTAGGSSQPLLSRMLLETAGMVTDDPPDPSGYIIETDSEDMDIFVDERAYPGDLMTIDIGQDQNVELNNVFTVYNIGEEIRHPMTGALIGNAVRVAGVCRVVETTPASSVVLLEHSYLPIAVGDYVAPYSAEVAIPVSPSQVVSELDAYVLAFQDPDLEKAYSFDVIYIDEGANNGLQAGDVFDMYKYGQPVVSPTGATVQTPDIPVSQIIILEPLENTSSAMIYRVATTELISVGDRIELVRQQQ